MAVRSPTRVRDSESVSPLFEACKTGDTAAVKQLATSENVNSRDVTGRKSTPLHFAAGKQTGVPVTATVCLSAMYVSHIPWSYLHCPYTVDCDSIIITVAAGRQVESCLQRLHVHTVRVHEERIEQVL